jgi:hypothetical protein
MVQYFNACVRGMQGVAAKNDAPYDLSRARASVVEAEAARDDRSTGDRIAM